MMSDGQRCAGELASSHCCGFFETGGHGLSPRCVQIVRRRAGESLDDRPAQMRLMAIAGQAAMGGSRVGAERHLPIDAQAPTGIPRDHSCNHAKRQQFLRIESCGRIAVDDRWQVGLGPTCGRDHGSLPGVRRNLTTSSDNVREGMARQAEFLDHDDQTGNSLDLANFGLGKSARCQRGHHCFDEFASHEDGAIAASRHTQAMRQKWINGSRQRARVPSEPSNRLRPALLVRKARVKLRINFYRAMAGVPRKLPADSCERMRPSTFPRRTRSPPQAVARYAALAAVSGR